VKTLKSNKAENYLRMRDRLQRWGARTHSAELLHSRFLICSRHEAPSGQRVNHCKNMLFVNRP
jgi:hypothetical protein